MLCIISKIVKKNMSQPRIRQTKILTIMILKYVATKYYEFPWQNCKNFRNRLKNYEKRYIFQVFVLTLCKHM